MCCLSSQILYFNYFIGTAAKYFAHFVHIYIQQQVCFKDLNYWSKSERAINPHVNLHYKSGRLLKSNSPEAKHDIQADSMTVESVVITTTDGPRMKITFILL